MNPKTLVFLVCAVLFMAVFSIAAAAFWPSIAGLADKLSAMVIGGLFVLLRITPSVSATTRSGDVNVGNGPAEEAP